MDDKLIYIPLRLWATLRVIFVVGHSILPTIKAEISHFELSLSLGKNMKSQVI